MIAAKGCVARLKWLMGFETHLELKATFALKARLNESLLS
jgi:hypothetical protein